MGISFMFNRTATTEREEYVGESQTKKAFVPHLSAFSCHFQPLDESITQDGRAAFGKNWLVVCDVKDIQEGDKMIISGESYKVAGVETYDFGDNPHMEVSVRLFGS